jgi:hypothetical protein
LYEPDSKEANSLKEITRFDLAEYVQTYGELRTDIDILDLGYWSQTGDDVLDTIYEPPTYSWREERDERRRVEEAKELKRQAELDKWIEERAERKKAEEAVERKRQAELAESRDEREADRL